MEPLLDRYGRRIEYLRVSVTDRCNLRCLYCLPAGLLAGLPAGLFPPQTVADPPCHMAGAGLPATGCPFKPREEILSYEEILRLARILAGLGIRRFRITGGEPLVRQELVQLVAGLSQIPGVEELALSTNGILLAQYAYPLKEAGLRRVNVSLDSLDPETFHRITRLGDWQKVWRGIWTALEVGLAPVKLNVVLLKGINEADVFRFAELTLSHPFHVRFIELMPHGSQGFDHPAHFLSVGEARAICERLGPLEPALDVSGAGPAVSFRLSGARGTLGFIGALTCNFCSRCNRMRLSADGFLRPCLDNATGVNLRDPLRRGAPPEELERLIRQAVAMKPESHTMRIGGGSMDWEPMCAIGG